MSNKRTEPIHLKISENMHEMIKKMASKNDRTIQQEVVRLIKLGLHNEKFDPSDYE